MRDLYAFPDLARTSPEFPAALWDVADELGTDANFIAAVMQNESGFNPQAVNPWTRATGLIQWMPATAKGQGTSVEALQAMTDLEQLPWVAKYLRPFRESLTDAGQVYMAVFNPAHLGKPDEYVLYAAGTKAYEQNRSLDVDKNGAITAGDVRAKARGTFAAAKARGVFSRVPAGGAGGSVETGGAGLGPVDPYAANVPQTTCDPSPKPGVVAFRELVLSTFGGRDGGIARECSIGGASEHKEGRAWDWMVPNADAARACLDWLLASEGDEEHARARRFGVQYMIWDRQLWSAYPPRGWRPYTGKNPHTDHVHFSFSWDGARGLTSGYRGAAGAAGPALAGSPIAGSSLGVLGFLLLLAPAAYVAWDVANSRRFT